MGLTPPSNTDHGTFSGMDVKAMILVPDILRLDETAPTTIELSNITTVSWSTHREKVPVRRIGRSYAQGYTHGTRTIAGSMVFINFNKAALWDLISMSFTPAEGAAVHSVMTDQIPPFDMNFLFVNEEGLLAFMTIFGIEIIDEGMVIGTDETYLETTMQYVARDIDLLNPGPNLREAWDNIGSESTFFEERFATKEEAEARRVEVGLGQIVEETDHAKPWTLGYFMPMSTAYTRGLSDEQHNKKFKQQLANAGFGLLTKFFDPTQHSIIYDSAGNPHLDIAAIHNQWLSMDPDAPDTTTPIESPPILDDLDPDPGMPTPDPTTDTAASTTPGFPEPPPPVDATMEVTFSVVVTDVVSDGDPLSGAKVQVSNIDQTKALVPDQTTGPTGICSVTLLPQSLILSVSKAGYIGMQRTIVPTEGMTVHMPLTMES